MYFKDRRDAGRQLNNLLTKYKESDVIVFALPRGGVVVADEIANYLHAPLDVLLAHKIGYPDQPEYAVAAVSENGHLVGNSLEIAYLGKDWLENEKQKQINALKIKRKLYAKEKTDVSLLNKVALIVDDGIATGLTMRAGILELKDRGAKSIVAVVPVTPKSTAILIKTMVDDFISVFIPEEHQFFGSVGAYYDEFTQVEDEEVIKILNKHY